MAKYKAYPEYKDSGVELLGEVPLTWRVFKLKFGLSEPLVYGANEAALDDNPDNPRYIRITDMNPDGSLRNDTFKSLPKVTSEPYMLIDGDILLARSGATVGKSFYYKSIFGPSCFAGYLIRARFNGDRIIPRLAYWFFQSSIYWQYVSGSQIQATIQNVSAEKYSDLYLSTPLEYAEQALIADFLDYETAKIDNLIEKQQQLIELLKEKRQAVISHAVTKGLNPDVPMKDSGVEWLGDVPAHWDICLLKFKCSAITDGAHISPDTNEGEHYFVSIKDIKKGIIDFNNSLLTSSASYKYLVKTGCKPFSGDILFSKDGTIGQTAIVPDDVDFVVASSLIIIRADKEKTLPAFMDLLLQSSLVKEQVESFVKGAALRRLSIQNLEKVFGIFPTLSEQQIISDYIYAQLNRLDVLESKAVVQIQLLEERRTALISAAVTGKIDVRDWVAPDTQDVEEPQEATA